MWRKFGSIGLILVLGCATASAEDTITLSVSGLATTYTPGSTLTFKVGLSGAANLNSYNVGLDLTSSKGTAGTDFYFEGSPNTYRPPDSANSYIFDSGLGVSSPFGFVATADTIPATNMDLLSLSDFVENNQFVLDEFPDTTLATVVIGTTVNAGNLTLSFDGSVLDLLDPNGQTVPGSINSSNPPPVVAQTPEPTSITLLCTFLGLAGVAIGWRQRHRDTR